MPAKNRQHNRRPPPQRRGAAFTSGLNFRAANGNILVLNNKHKGAAMPFIMPREMEHTPHMIRLKRGLFIDESGNLSVINGGMYIYWITEFDRETVQTSRTLPIIGDAMLHGGISHYLATADKTGLLRSMKEAREEHTHLYSYLRSISSPSGTEDHPSHQATDETADPRECALSPGFPRPRPLFPQDH